MSGLPVLAAFAMLLQLYPIATTEVHISPWLNHADYTGACHGIIRLCGDPDIDGPYLWCSEDAYYATWAVLESGQYIVLDRVCKYR